MKLSCITPVLASLLLAGCAVPAATPSAKGEVCDIVEPPTGSRMTKKVLCEPKKPDAQRSS